MRTDYIDKDTISHIIFGLCPANRLVCKVALETGLRIGDVLSIKTADLKKSSFTITEQKTQKKKKVRISDHLKKELLSQAGKIYVFEHRLDPNKHRTRQAVFNDLKKVAKFFKIKQNIAPHTLRKLYAVDLYCRSGKNLEKVREALNHDNDLTTVIYALADLLQK